MSTKIIPLDDNVLVELVGDGDTKTKGGIVITAKARENHRDAIVAKVIEVGPGRTTEYGSRMEITVKVGDLVLLPRTGGCQVETDDNTKRRILRCVELLGVVEESRVITL